MGQHSVIPASFLAYLAVPLLFCGPLLVSQLLLLYLQHLLHSNSANDFNMSSESIRFRTGSSTASVIVLVVFYSVIAASYFITTFLEWKKGKHKQFQFARLGYTFSFFYRLLPAFIILINSIKARTKQVDTYLLRTRLIIIDKAIIAILASQDLVSMLLALAYAYQAPRKLNDTNASDGPENERILTCYATRISSNNSPANDP